jgi:hypothetical protein
MYVKQLAQKIGLDDLPETWYKFLTNKGLVVTKQYGYNRFFFEATDHHRTQMWSFFVNICSVFPPTTTITTTTTTITGNYYRMASCLWKIWYPPSTVATIIGSNNNNNNNDDDEDMITYCLNKSEADLVDGMVYLSSLIKDKRDYYWQIDAGTVLAHSEVAVVSNMTDMIELCINMHIIGIKTMHVLHIYNRQVLELDISSLDFSWLSRYPLQALITNNTKRIKRLLCLGLPPTIGNSLQFWLIQLWFHNQECISPLPFVTTLLNHTGIPKTVISTYVNEITRTKVKVRTKEIGAKDDTNYDYTQIMDLLNSLC